MDSAKRRRCCETSTDMLPCPYPKRVKVKSPKYSITKRSKDKASPTNSNSSRNHLHYLGLAKAKREELDPPLHSRFRVVAVLRLENGDVVFGSNDEPGPCISGAICAERAALLQLRLVRKIQKVSAVYICSDSETPITPGLLCREYMMGHRACGPNVEIVLAQDKTQPPQVMSLADLYPFPSLYLALSAPDQMAKGLVLQKKIQQRQRTLSLPPYVEDVINAAKEAASQDSRDELHPIRYGAAAALKTADGRMTIVKAAQRKALEYGSTLSAVSQLAPFLFAAKRASDVLILAHVDQFGVAHAPFASGRALLTEHGFAHVGVVITRDDGSCVVIPARELAPSPPVISQQKDAQKKRMYSCKNIKEGYVQIDGLVLDRE